MDRRKAKIHPTQPAELVVDMTPRVAIIFSILLILACGYSFELRAQSRPAPATTPTKFDEFGAVGHCDMGARLDNFAIQLSSTPGATAQLIVYGPDRGSAGKDLIKILTDYLHQIRGIAADQIKGTYGGRNSDLAQPRVQLWIVPENNLPVEPEKFENNIATFKGLFHESTIYDDFGVWYEFPDAMGPGIGRSIDASFADILHTQTNSVGYIVAYNGPDSLPGAWRRHADKSIERLKRFDIDQGRLKVIFAGNRDESKVQLWVLPKVAPPPVAEAGRESMPKQVITAGRLSADYLSYKEHETLSFKIVADVLKIDKSMRAFMVVRLDPPPPPPDQEQETVEEEAADEEPASVIPESEVPENPDLTKLVEKWRSELTTIHKIRNDRIIVIFLPGTQSSSNAIDVWFVPKGQPLPDPNKEEEEDDEEEIPEPPAKPN